MVAPTFGLLTAIGQQHLETFKNIDNTRLAKYELVDALPVSGKAFLNMDDVNISHKSHTAKCKVVSYGIEQTQLDYRAGDITYDLKGTSFYVQKVNGQRALFRTKLLGKHNVYNLLASIAVASELGLNFNSIAYAVSKLEPVSHRLEIRQMNNVTIIDDAFNSNPMGCRMALEVLKGIEGTQKVIITPGMVELGSEEYRLNKEFGMVCADVCDYIILVGPKRTIPIQEGIREKNYPGENIYVAMNLNDAIRHMNMIVKPGSIVLFENDLPDNFNE